METLIKSPIEKYPIRFNYSVDFIPGELITNLTLTCVNAATGVSTKTTIIDSETNSSPEIVVVLKAGTEGDEHHIQSVITTNLGNSYQRDLLLAIQTVVSDSFGKQPSDRVLFDVDFTRRLETGDTVFSGSVLATKESDGSDVSATVIPLVEVLSPRVGVHTAAGDDLETYLLGVRATTNAGYVYEKPVRMNVQEIP